MSRRGEIVVECDTKGCQAERRFNADEIADIGLRAAKYAEGWRWYNNHDICPQCEEEQARAVALRYTRAKPREADAATR
jgi:hypothetical protein